MTDESISPLMTRAEVAAAFRVDPQTVSGWAKTGKLTSIRTPGGYYRYSRAEVEALLRGDTPERRPLMPPYDPKQLEDEAEETGK
ncbi:MAG TPA: BldC family transcriptional regulator [Streptomyces sp.]|jgi:hypothetical protein